MGEINKLEYILDLFEKGRNDYICLIYLDSETYEIHSIQEESIFNIPEGGTVKSLLKYLHDQIIPQELKPSFKKKITRKKICKALQTTECLSYQLHVGDNNYKIYIHYMKDDPEKIVVRIKMISVEVIPDDQEDEGTDVEEIASEGLVLLQLDAQKRFTIREVSDNVPVIFDMSKDEFLENFRDDPFAGFLNKDRIKADR